MLPKKVHFLSHSYFFERNMKHSGNGILDEMELKVGLEQLGVDVSNASMVLTMMMEAGIAYHI